MYVGSNGGVPQQPSGRTDVFVGGLPPRVTEQNVSDALSSIGMPPAKIQYRSESGFGVVQFASLEVARKASRLLRDVLGHPVGANILQAASETSQSNARASTPHIHQAAGQPAASVNVLLQHLRRERQAGSGAAELAVATALKKGPLSHSQGGLDFIDQTNVSTSDGEPRAGSSSQLKEGGSAQTATLPLLGTETPAAMPAVTSAAAPSEDPFPRCTHLIKAYQSMPNSQNKTPLAVLHEYAVRFNLEVLYTESAESSLGPFTVETRLCRPNGSATSDVATGQGRTKKDAKQRAASRILEAVLARMSLQDFLKAPGSAASTVGVNATPPSLADSVLTQCMPAAAGAFVPSKMRPQGKGVGDASGADRAGNSGAGQAAGHATPAGRAAAQQTAAGEAGAAQTDSLMAERLPQGLATPSTSGSNLLRAARAAVQVSEAPVVTAGAAEDGFPRCKHLIEAYHALPNSQNKTPLAVLHDYATRLGLEMSYVDNAGGAAGPFHVEAKLMSQDSMVLYARGSGQGRAKKEAKQQAASAVLETLLANVPLEDFLPRPPEKAAPEQQGSPEPEAAEEEPAAPVGAQQSAPPSGTAAPAPKLIAAFGPRGPSVEDIRLAVWGAYPPNPNRLAEGAAAGEPVQGQSMPLAVTVERRPEVQLSRKRSLE